MKFKAELNWIGLTCPMPLLKTKQALRRLDVGDWVRVVTSDPSTLQDFVTFSQSTSHRLYGMYQLGKHFFFIFQV